MNDGKESQNEKLEKLLTKARLSEPSTELKERITAEARRVWSQTSVELSWRIPIRRLVASVAAAVFVIWLANVSSDYSLARWQSDETSVRQQRPSEIKVLPEMPYGPIAGYLNLAKPKLPATDASGLREYVETVRRLLDEIPQNGESESSDPAQSRSRALPDQSGTSSYS